MKTAILWGTRDNVYKDKLFIYDSDEDKEAERMANIIEDYVGGYEQTSGYILGVWDPFQIVEDNDNEKLTYEKFFDERVSYKREIIIYTFFLFTYYSPKDKNFVIHRGKLKRIAKMINVCTGWEDNEEQKISFRLESGITEPFSQIRKKEMTEFIKCKLIRYMMANYFAPGEFWKKLQEKYGINTLIIPSPIHTIIVGDSFIVSCDHLPRLSLKKEGPKKIVNYKIDSALIYGLKEIAGKQKRSVTDVFRSALID